MSGHSHWAGIKHKKAANDAKRGKLWSKLARAVIIAAKSGGGDPSQNLALRFYSRLYDSLDNCSHARTFR